MNKELVAILERREIGRVVQTTGGDCPSHTTRRWRNAPNHSLYRSPCLSLSPNMETIKSILSSGDCCPIMKRCLTVGRASFQFRQETLLV